MRTTLLPFSSSARLFLTGATVGPIVDSLHNQCLLKYNIAPIALVSPLQQLNIDDNSAFFCSSWAVPPLLGFAYVVLGGLLPKLFQIILDNFDVNWPQRGALNSITDVRSRAFWAVATTALIIKLSEYLEVYHPFLTGDTTAAAEASTNVFVLMIAALSQWFLLDGTLSALIVASITSIGGPLAELPFVAGGVWEYLPEAGDYFPLQNLFENSNLLQSILGENYRSLALSSITGPCYFAVTMDSIALGRYFDSMKKEA